MNNPEKDNMQFYTVDDLERILRVSGTTIYRWIRLKKLPALRIQKKFLFPKKEFEKWLSGQYFNP